MGKIKVGLPKALTYYYYHKFWQYFFEELDIDIIYSCETNNDILKRGEMIANDEMCLSLKVFLGHIDYLKDKCDYILIPRIEQYNDRNQTCTNFLALYDLVNNLFDIKILNYNISCDEDELLGLIDIGHELGLLKDEVINAYKKAKQKEQKYYKEKQQLQLQKLNDDKSNILVISHPYNTYDKMIGNPIIKMLEKYNLNIIYCDLFDKRICNQKALEISPNIYWKYSKECIGSLTLASKVKGIIFLSSFPCGLDSLVNEFLIRKINKPYLNIIIDNLDSLTGMETRIESFVDIVTQN